MGWRAWLSIAATGCPRVAPLDAPAGKLEGRAWPHVFERRVIAELARVDRDDAVERPVAAPEAGQPQAGHAHDGVTRKRPPRSSSPSARQRRRQRARRAQRSRERAIASRLWVQTGPTAQSVASVPPRPRPAARPGEADQPGPPLAEGQTSRPRPLSKLLLVSVLAHSQRAGREVPCVRLGQPTPGGFASSAPREPHPARCRARDRVRPPARRLEIGS